jgi:hypothetical protein
LLSGIAHDLCRWPLLVFYLLANITLHSSSKLACSTEAFFAFLRILLRWNRMVFSCFGTITRYLFADRDCDTPTAADIVACVLPDCNIELIVYLCVRFRCFIFICFCLYRTKINIFNRRGNIFPLFSSV